MILSDHDGDARVSVYDYGTLYRYDCTEHRDDGDYQRWNYREVSGDTTARLILTDVGETKIWSLVRTYPEWYNHTRTEIEHLYKRIDIAEGVYRYYYDGAEQISAMQTSQNIDKFIESTVRLQNQPRGVGVWSGVLTVVVILLLSHIIYFYTKLRVHWIEYRMEHYQLRYPGSRTALQELDAVYPPDASGKQ